MANGPRRQTNPLDAAEALFRPVPKKSAAPPSIPKTIPEGKETVSLRLDRAVLEFFQEDGPGWQDRINDALRHFMASQR